MLVVKELIRLLENFFPWAHTDARPGCDAVARVMRLRGVQAKIVLMGSMTTVPSSYEENIVAQAVFRVARRRNPPRRQKKWMRSPRQPAKLSSNSTAA